MEHDKFKAVNRCIRETAQQAAASGGLAALAIERFLRISEETWDGAGSGRFTPAQFENNEAYRKAAKTALRTLFRLLANLLPAEAQLAPQSGSRNDSAAHWSDGERACAGRLAGGRPP